MEIRFTGRNCVTHLCVCVCIFVRVCCRENSGGTMSAKTERPGAHPGIRRCWRPKAEDFRPGRRYKAAHPPVAASSI